MPFSASSSFQRFWPALFLALALWVGCVQGLNIAGVFDMDEGLYSTASRQMLESGDVVVPRVGENLRINKPPLIYWLQVPFIAAFGPIPAAVRMPSALAAIGTALLLWAWARSRGSARAGFLAAMIYALCPLTLAVARQGVIDSVLALCFTLVMIGWIEGERGNKRGWALWAAAMGVATLAKGIIGFLLPGAAFVLWHALQFKSNPTSLESAAAPISAPKRVLHTSATLVRVPWLLCFGVFLAVALPWHAAIYARLGDRFIQEYFVANHLQRFTGEKFGHVQPFWFYLPVLLVGMFPLSVFIPLAWFESLKRAFSRQPETLDSEIGGISHRELSLWGVWAVVAFAFFSVSKSKLPTYILPAVPALALLVAARLEDSIRARQPVAKFERVLLRIVSAALTLAFLLPGVAGWMANQNGARVPLWTIWTGQTLRPRLVELLVPLAPLLLSLGVVVGVGTALLWSGRDAARTAKVALVLNAALALVLAQWGLRVWNAHDIAPLHDLGRRALPELNQGAPMVIYALKPRRTSLRYVVGHTAQVLETDDPAQARERLRGGGLLLVQTGRPTLPTANAQLVASASKFVLWKFSPQSALRTPTRAPNP